MQTTTEETKPRRKKKKKKKAGGLNGDHPLKRRAREANLKRLAASIKKKHSVVPINAGGVASAIEYISTGYQELDDALSGSRTSGNKAITEPGTGKGFPRGRIVEVYGQESASKTSLALAVIAQAQRQGERCAYIDVEHALDPYYAHEAMGVDMSEDMLLHYEPDDAETALAVLTDCVKAGVSVVVLDSVAALSSKAELEGSKALGEQARLMSQVCRRLTTQLKAGGSLVIFINQIRYKIGVMFGNPEFTSGGHALKFYSSVRAEVRKKKDIKKSGAMKGEPVVVGHRIRLRVIKNKVAPPFGSALFDVMVGEGIKIPKLKSKRGSKDDASGS